MLNVSTEISCNLWMQLYRTRCLFLLISHKKFNICSLISSIRVSVTALKVSKWNHVLGLCILWSSAISRYSCWGLPTLYWCSWIIAPGGRIGFHWGKEEWTPLMRQYSGVLSTTQYLSFEAFFFQWLNSLLKCLCYTYQESHSFKQFSHLQYFFLALPLPPRDSISKTLFEKGKF